MAILSTTLTPVLTPDLSTQVSDLQARVAKLEAVLQISSTGDVLIKSDTAIKLDAGTTLTLKASSSATFTSATTMSVTSSGTMTIKGSMVNIN